VRAAAAGREGANAPADWGAARAVATSTAEYFMIRRSSCVIIYCDERGGGGVERRV
jgi:hypothetical protein